MDGAGPKFWRGPLKAALETYLGKRLSWRLPERVQERLARASQPRSLSGSPRNPSGDLALLVTHELSPSGAPRVLADIARTLTDAGWRVVVVSPVDGPFRQILVNHGVEVFVSASALENSDVLAHLVPSATLLLCNTIMTRRVVAEYSKATTTVWYLHETGAIRDVVEADPVTLSAFASSATIWCASRLVVDAVHPYHPRPKLLLLPAGADVGFHERPPLGETVKIGVFASVEPRKGQDLVMEALPRVHEKVSVGFWGAVRDEVFAARLMKSVLEAPEVEYHGLLAPDALLEIFAAQDIILIPSRDEPLSLVALEALSAGVPVVITGTCGIAEELTDGVSAFIATSATAADIAETIERAVEQSAAWPNMAVAGRDLFDRKFAMPVFRKRLMAALDRVSDEQGRPAPPA